MYLILKYPFTIFRMIFYLAKNPSRFFSIDKILFMSLPKYLNIVHGSYNFFAFFCLPQTSDFYLVLNSSNLMFLILDLFTLILKNCTFFFNYYVHVLHLEVTLYSHLEWIFTWLKIHHIFSIDKILFTRSSTWWRRS